MSFTYPRLLWFLCLLPLFFAAQWFIRSRRPNPPTGNLARRRASGAAVNLPLRRFLSDSFFLLFLGFIVLALAGPVQGYRYVPEYRRGLDLMAAVDLSGSMLVDDCTGPDGQPLSRLEKGKRLAGDLVRNLQGLRTGAAMGKGRGIIALPLTWDTGAVESFFNALGDFSISGRGTNLERLVDAAAGAFQDDFPARRCILLLTDGEGHTGSLQAALERAARQDITVSFAGLGTDEGGPVPGLEGPVLSVRRGELMKGLAAKYGGIYVDGNREDAAAILSREFSSLAAGSAAGARRREPYPRWRLFLLAALAALALSRSMGLVPRKGRSAKARLGALFIALTLSGCRDIRGKLLIMEGNFLSSRGMYSDAIASYLQALKVPGASAYGEFGLASVYAALEEGEAALQRYESAREEAAGLGGEHRELLYRVYYNKGVLLFEQGRFDEAAAAFRSALEVDGARVEAKRNLELSLLSGEAPPEMAAQRQRPAEGGGQGEDGADEGTRVLFNYLRMKEEDRWKNREWEGEKWSGEDDYSGPDY